MKIICFILSVSIVYVADSTPIKLGRLEFDNLDTDLSDLRYEVEEEDLDDYSKFLDDLYDKSSSANSKDDNSKTDSNKSGLKTTNVDSAGVKGKYNLGKLKEILKLAGLHNLDTFDAANIFALAKGIAAAAVETSGNESRNYKKGTKTRGFHRVHHKDEYKKDQEFYEDDEIKGSINKVGAKALGAKIGAGAGIDKGYYHHDRQKGIRGKEGYFDKGYLDAEINKYIATQSLDDSLSV